MSREKPNEISPHLTIPGFRVKVANTNSCQVTSKDGRYKVTAKIAGHYIKISGNMFPKPLIQYLALSPFTTIADDVITHVANSLRVMDEFTKEGFSAKIVEEKLVLSHPSKPNYSLRMHLTDARRLAFSTYTEIEYCGPAYAPVGWWAIDNRRFVKIEKDFEELSRQLKARILNLGEPDPRIAQWVSEEIEKELLPLGFTITSAPKETTVELSHPVGLSGSFSWAIFTVGYKDYPNPKYPNPYFPDDIERKNLVLFNFYLPTIQKPYTKSWLVNEPHEVINDMRRLLALVVIHQEVCNAWKSDILIPKLNGNRLQLVNTRLKESESTILEITPIYDKLLLKTRGEQHTYPIPDTPNAANTKEITQDIVDRADRHVQEFLQKKGNNRPRKVTEIDL
jgi:hypothetical protein